MEASILDLRYHMKKILQALARNEEVKIYYHGKLKGVLTPFKQGVKRNVENHPFFGMYKEDKDSVEDVMNQLRGEGYHVD